MARATIVAGNWKMNLGREESLSLARGVAEIEAPAGIELAIYPATVWVDAVAQAVGSSSLRVGAQNCSTETSGAFTGEVSATMLAEICGDVLAGHSERRHVFGESDETVGRKVRAILDAGLRAVLCVGETIEERERGDADSIVERQLQTGLANVSTNEIDNVVIAYEPVWAIGTGVAATPEDAQAMCAFVRSVLGRLHGEAGTMRPILYGGSVSPSNAVSLFQKADIDGGLVGGASLDVQSFRAIVEAAAEAR